MAWLDVLNALIEEEVSPALEGAGFQRTGLRWRRGRPGEARPELRLGWPVVWEIESHLMPGPVLARLVAAELDRRGLERHFVSPRPPPGGAKR